LFFTNHLPIRIRGEWEELWLGYDYLNFGGHYIRAYKNKKGEWIIWYRHDPAYSDGKSFNYYLGKVRHGNGDPMSLFPPNDVYPEDGRIYFSTTDRGKILDWLDSLGLAKVEVFD